MAAFSEISDGLYKNQLHRLQTKMDFDWPANVSTFVQFCKISTKKSTKFIHLLVWPVLIYIPNATMVTINNQLQK